MDLFKNPADDLSENPNLEPERQCCGYTIAIIQVIYCLFFVAVGPFSYNLGALIGDPELLVILERFSPFPLRMTYSLWASIAYRLGYLVIAAYFIWALHDPKLLGGNPKPIKIVPLLAGMLLIRCAIPNEIRFTSFAIFGLVTFLIFGAIAYGIYIKDDTSPAACCLCLKPWIYKPKLMTYPPQGYPPYGAPILHAYPPQGYPPMQGHPPMMMQGHPPQVAPHMGHKV